MRDCLARECGDRRLRLEEPLDPARGDLRERVVLERRPDVEAHLVAVVLLGALGELAHVEVGQPQLGQIGERARGISSPRCRTRAAPGAAP